MFEQEIWVDIKGYDNFYKISSFGRLKNKNGKILKENKSRDYLQYQLRKNNKRQCKGVHKWVAEVFLDKKDFKCMPYEDRNMVNLDELEVNHKDENKLNNNVNNLEWCTAKYNANYGTKIKRIKRKLGKPIKQFERDDVFVKKWNSISEASKELGINRKSIMQCCNHEKRHKTAGGYKWEFDNDNN